MMEKQCKYSYEIYKGILKSGIKEIDASFFNKYTCIKRIKNCLDNFLSEIGYRFNDWIKWPLQKIFRGYSDPDLWSLDSHLAELIYVRLKAFKNMNKNGAPYNMFDNPDKCEQDDFDFMSAEARWQNTIWKMMWAFEYIKDGYDHGDKYFDLTFPNKDEVDLVFNPTEKEGMSEVKFTKEPDIRYDIIKKLNEQMEEGLELFIKYLPNLWD